MCRLAFLLGTLALMLSASAGVAVGHNINCYTAVGYTITCVPKPHDNVDPWGTPVFGYKTGSTATQWSPGSFYWNDITMTDGYTIQPAALGDTYIWQSNPYSEIYYSRLWFCFNIQSLSYLQTSFGGSGLFNGTTQGTWDQYSTTGPDCYSPTPFQDYTTWLAY